MIANRGQPLDWTNGTNAVPAGGTITVLGEPNRSGVFVQNLSSAAVVTVQPACLQAGTQTTASTGTISLAAGASLSLGPTSFLFNGPFNVVATSGTAVTVLTV